MRDLLLDIIEKHPKHYPRIIKKDQAMMDWIQQKTLIQGDDFRAKLRSAIYSETNVCANGRTKKIGRFVDGFIGCGPAADCPCTKSQISESVKIAKSKISEEEKAESNAKRAQSMVDLYGVPFNLQREAVKEKIRRPKIALPTHSKLSNKEWLEEEYVTKKRSLVDIAAELGVYYSTVNDYCYRHGFEIRQRSQYSVIEIELAAWLESLGVRVVTNDRSILQGKEIDILLPDHNLGVEINGLYWHSFNPASGKKENSKQHITKTLAAESAGVQLMHFTDFHWNAKKDIVKNIIRSKLGLNERVYARKCDLSVISTAVAREFFDRHHLDGFAAAKRYYGLIDKAGNLVQCLSMSKKRFGDHEGAEIVRVATVGGVTVIGGLSKLISAAKKEFDGTIVTFCSRDISNGNGYKAVGFAEVRITGPGYFWTDSGTIISRQRAQRKTLSKWLPGYRSDWSEAENMFAAGYRRYWNTGNIYFEMQ